MKANITYKSVLTDLTIEQRNEAFNKLDKQSQRLEIAWDALQLVLSRSLKASYGAYWSIGLIDLKGDSKELQALLNTKSNLKGCHVCQRGLMMVSQIRLGNSISSFDSYKCLGRKENIKGFNMRSFFNMEKEFECTSFGHPYRANTKEKLANICCNILINGDFNTKDKTDYLCKI